MRSATCSASISRLQRRLRERRPHRQGPQSYGGSLIRPEATGFGAVYYLVEVLKHEGEDIKGKTIAAAGFGNVAWGICQQGLGAGRQGRYPVRPRRLLLRSRRHLHPGKAGLYAGDARFRPQQGSGLC
ncbi:MAG: hypothetical protein ACLSCQ_06805 [Evtepia gabavorous]